MSQRLKINILYMNKILNLKIENIPESIGCYIFKKNNSIVYIGKSKNIRNRILSHFKVNKKIIEFEIDEIDFIITQNIRESLILEQRLIREKKPRFNILLKDDSNFPYIIITNYKKNPNIGDHNKLIKINPIYKIILNFP